MAKQAAQASGAGPALSLPIKAGIAALSGWWALELGPPVMEGELLLVPAAAYCVAAIASMQTLIASAHQLACFADWLGGRTPTGRAGTSHWATAKELKGELSKKRTGPFWGRSLKDRLPLFIDYASNALVLGPAGSSKGIAAVIPSILFINEDKIIPDFKGENVVITKCVLEARGEKVAVLNPPGIFKELIGKSDCSNPLDVILGNFFLVGGLLLVPDDCREICAQLIQEPDGKQTDNSYFREGGRRIIAFAIVVEVIVDGYQATLSSVAKLIDDTERLEDLARWVLGIDLDGNPHPDGPLRLEQTEWAALHEPGELEEFRIWLEGRARNLLRNIEHADSKGFEAYLNEAQQALAPFAFGALAKATGPSTFRMEELKEGKQTTSLFIVADASRMEAYKQYLGLVHWHAFTVLKRHPNKERRVRAILDEATNYKIAGLEDLLTWGRGYGLSLYIVVQDLMAFSRAYGQTALDTLLSETEIKQVMPGNRSPKTLQLISKEILGEQSVMAVGTGRNAGQLQASENISEQGRPLMSADEVRRAEHGILVVRSLPPIAFEPTSYAEISPFRDKVGINPFHGKRFKKRIKLRV